MAQAGNGAVGVDNTFRRKFDKEEYLERARERERQTADIFLGLEYLDDLIPQTSSGTGNDGRKLASKVDADVQNGENFLSSFCVNNDLRGSISSSGMETHPLEGFGAEAHCFFESSEFTICDVGPPQTSSDRHTNEQVEVQVDNGSSETKAAGAFFDFETCEANVVSGQRAVKFQPKPKLGKVKEKPPKTSDSQDEVRSSLPSEAVDVVSFNHELVQESSISEFPRKDALDCSSSRLGDMSHLMPEIEGDAEATGFTEATRSEGAMLDDIHSEDGLRNVDSGTRTEEVSTESNCLRKSRRSSTTSEKVEDGKSSRQLRKLLKRSDDEPVDEGHDTDDSTYEPLSTSNIDEQEDNDDEYRVDTTSRKRKAPRKVKEPVTGNGKPVRRRKTSKKASDESAKGPPKSYPIHPVRTEGMALLDTPEDEIDPQRLPIRDLIILAEHRERMMIKDAAKLKIPRTNQSADNSLHGSGSRNEEETLSEQGQYSDEDCTSPKDQPNPIYFNYQTYMKKTSSTRWSKHETELFYEAVRQFGTDFSLIQQLFPNRTRHQVKLKFKKEERQHPLRLSEAATNRAKDHLHFESVIELLQQQAAAQAKQGSYENDSAAAMGEEEVRDTATHDINEGATKPPEKDSEVVKEQEAEVVEVHNSPLKSEESDDDPDMWNEYNF